jgi:small subunit ribosomal protein S14
MAKKSKIAREKKLKKLHEKYKLKRAALKAAGDFLGLDKLPKGSAKERQRRRCKLNGKSRGHIRRFGLSQKSLIEYAYKGYVSGIKKASW